MKVEVLKITNRGGPTQWSIFYPLNSKRVRWPVSVRTGAIIRDRLDCLARFYFGGATWNEKPTASGVHGSEIDPPVKSTGGPGS